MEPLNQFHVEEEKNLLISSPLKLSIAAKIEKYLRRIKHVLWTVHI